MHFAEVTIMQSIDWEKSTAADKRLFAEVLDDISIIATSGVLVYQSVSCD